MLGLSSEPQIRLNEAALGKGSCETQIGHVFLRPLGSSRGAVDSLTGVDCPPAVRGSGRGVRWRHVLYGQLHGSARG
jgi:hypothetical protein